MPGDERVANWIVDKLKGERDFTAEAVAGSGFLEVACKGFAPFVAVAIGVPKVITLSDVASLFEAPDGRPQFVVNVPSRAIWSGPAIDFIHEASAAFGTYGEMLRASREDPVSSYRHREYKFFERAFRQHSAIAGLTRVYDKVFQLHRRGGMRDVTVALVDAYDMSAEDIRRTRELYGGFDAAVKISSYGSITSAAHAAASSMGVEAFTFGELMGRLNKP